SVPGSVRVDAALHGQRRRQQFSAGLLRRYLHSSRRVSLSLAALHIGAVVLDIEGTTTPVDFVYKVLFPYARTHVDAYVAANWNSEPCGESIALLQRERGAALSDVAA